MTERRKDAVKVHMGEGYWFRRNGKETGSRMGESEEWEKYRMEIKIERHWPVAGNERHEHGI